jgi:hypothetical protein
MSLNSATHKDNLDHPNWLSQIVETPDGVGTVISVEKTQVTVTHEFPTYDVTKSVYAKQDVAVIPNPNTHPAYGTDEFRRQSVEQLKTQTEPTIFLS